ncbi:PqqD family peptide modification chaperone [Emergencia sp. JLR.KK010]|uniref:radical SAM protein n=1 Tax=Emergencia sp. JLR.KK010 TaxID=3114296 RepID=UPI0030D47219
MTGSEKIAYSKNISWQDIDDTVFIIEEKTNRRYRLDDTARDIWLLLNNTVDNICCSMNEKYSDVDEEIILNDVSDLIFALYDEMLITIDGASEQKAMKEGEYSKEDYLGNIDSEMFEKEYEKRQLTGVMFELLTKCNWKCKHCYIPEHSEDGLSTEKIISLIREARTMGALNITFTGGEIFLRKDIMQLIRTARELYCSVSLLSNASLLDEKIVEELSRLYINNYSLTIFSLNEQIHDGITGIKGSLEDVLRNIRLLKKYEIPVTIKTPILKDNYKFYNEVKEFASKIDCTFSMSPTIFSKSNGDRTPHNYQLSGEELCNAIRDADKVTEKFKEGKPFLYKYDEPCATVYTNLFIDCNGMVTPCNSMYYYVGDIKKQSIGEIWKNSEELEYIRSIKKKDLKCNSCKLEPFCERCPGVALLEDGTFTGCCESSREAAILRTKIAKEVK